MAVVDLDSQHFYRQLPTKADLIGKKQLTASNAVVLTSDRAKKAAAAFKSRDESSANLQKYKVIEILDMTASFEKEHFNPFHELASDFKNIETTIKN